MEVVVKENNKKIIIVITILVVILSIAGGTFAYFRWQTNTAQKTLVTFTAERGFTCSADGGGNITQNDVTLIPTEVNASTTDNYIKRLIKTNINKTDSNMVVYMDLWLEIKELGSGLSNTEYFMYSLTSKTATGPDDNPIVSGNFNGLIANEDTIKLLRGNTDTSGEYYLWIWLHQDEEDMATSGQSFNFELNGECSDSPPRTTAQDLISNANSSTLMYTDASDEQKDNMWTFKQAATEQVPATTDYRFIGDSPNNYILFNGDEVWRIIGVFDGKIKIIKSTKIADTSYRFDYKKTDVGSSTTDNGSNDWTDSQLMYMLNTPFYKNGNTYNTTLMTQELLTTTMGDGTIRVYSLDGNFIKDDKENPNIIYELGKIPAAISASATSYSGAATAWELNDTAKSQIAKTTFYLGSTSLTSQSATAWYKRERGLTTPNSNKSPRSWTGYVGLMYPSDYAYTYAYKVDENCFNSTSSTNCPATVGEKSWLWNDVISASSLPWTISPYSSSADYVFLFYGINAGSVSIDNARYMHGVHPSIYLKSEIELSGTGSEGDPYRIIE